jgi:hypothetical protein
MRGIDHLAREMVPSLSPLLITGRFLRVRCEAIGFDALRSEARYVFKGDMQHGMFSDRCMTVSHDPFLMELG